MQILDEEVELRVIMAEVMLQKILKEKIVMHLLIDWADKEGGEVIIQGVEGVI